MKQAAAVSQRADHKVLEQVQEMKEILQSVQISSAPSVSSKPKPLANQVALTSLVGRKRLNLKRHIMRKQDRLTAKKFFQQ
jgi:hypothetical protein